LIDENQELCRLAELLGEARYGEIESRATALLGQFPASGLAWKVLGIARLMSGKDALATLHQAIVLLAEDGEAHYNFGVGLQQAGRFDLALVSFNRALEISPGDIDALRQRAVALTGLGRLAGAVDGYRTLLAIHPDCAEAHLNLGNLLKLQGARDDAVACYRRALRFNPSFADAHYNLGIVLHESGQHQSAVDCLCRAIELSPDHSSAHLNLGNALKSLGQTEKAAASYRAALAIRPDFAEAHLDLGNVLGELGLADQAIDCYRLALAIDPRFAAAHLNLGNTLKEVGRLDEALASYRRAIDIDPDFYAAHDNLLFTHNLILDQDPRTMFADALRFGECVAQRAQPYADWPNAPIPGKRLRVGLVSGDFRDHPVSHFLGSVLGALNAGGGAELFAYSNSRQSDALTARIRSHCHAWRAVAGMSDESVVRQIRADDIDILVDLSGHTEHNRLSLFAWKPAPVQVSWLGYHATTGVAAIDYLVADRWTVAASEEVWFSEKVWRLPETLWCLTPPDVALAVSPLPALAAGYVTFACFNRLDKMGDAVVALWARVLWSVPGSRLWLKALALRHDAARRRVVDCFAACGIGSDRLILEGPSSRAEYLAAYQRVDIALDPFPYAGATTSVEALWMGVPVITLAGERFMSRQGVSLLMNAGLPEWIGVDQDDYVACALRQVSDCQALAALRASLRAQVLASPLFDAQRFAVNLEAAWRGMWQAWCGRVR